jgi:hypothetical protein
MASISGFAFTKIVAALTLFATLLCQSGFAQQVSKRQRWEYCAITRFSANYPSQQDAKVVGAASICYFQDAGCRTEEVKFDLDLAEFSKGWDPRYATNESYVGFASAAKATEAVLARAIAKLGDDGWEMVGESIFRYRQERNDQAIYFKRKK